MSGSKRRTWSSSWRSATSAKRATDSSPHQPSRQQLLYVAPSIEDGLYLNGVALDGIEDAPWSGDHLAMATDADRGKLGREAAAQRELRRPAAGLFESREHLLGSLDGFV